MAGVDPERSLIWMKAATAERRNPSSIPLASSSEAGSRGGHFFGHTCPACAFGGQQLSRPGHAGITSALRIESKRQALALAGLFNETSAESIL